MVTAIIVDDDIRFLKILSKEIEEIAASLHMDLNIQIETNPLNCLNSGKTYDIYFLDIEMPELSGIDLVKQLREKYISREFVFVSAYDSYMRRSIYVKPSAFVRKEYLHSDLVETMGILKSMLGKRDVEFVVKNNGKDVVIKPGKIIYMKSDEHYVRIFDEFGKEMWIRNSLRLLEPQMKQFGFCRIHLRYLVNLNFVKDCYPDRIELKSGETFPISSPYIQSVRELFLNRTMAGEY